MENEQLFLTRRGFVKGTSAALGSVFLVTKTEKPTYAGTCKSLMELDGRRRIQTSRPALAVQ